MTFCACLILYHLWTAKYEIPNEVSGAVAAYSVVVMVINTLHTQTQYSAQKYPDCCLMITQSHPDENTLLYYYKIVI